MSEGRHTSIPVPVFSAFIGLVPIGVVIGILHGIGALSTIAMSAIVFVSLTVFVPWAVLHLDPRRIAEVGDGAPED